MNVAPEANAPPLISLLNYSASTLLLLLHKFSSGWCFALFPFESIRPSRRALSAYCTSISPDLTLPPVNRMLGSPEQERDGRHFLQPSTEGRVSDDHAFNSRRFYFEGGGKRHTSGGKRSRFTAVYGPSARVAREGRVGQTINKTASSRGGASAVIYACPTIAATLTVRGRQLSRCVCGWMALDRS